MSDKKLAIIDWGIGGLSVYGPIRERFGIGVTYLSDTGATPYGKMSRDELAGRLNAVISFLKARGVTHLVIGCNAASTAIGDIDRQGLNVVGMIEPATAMAVRLKPSQLGLIGGRRTVLSGVYRRAFAAHGIAVEQRIAQPLSAIIESGDTSSEHLRQTAKPIIGPIRNSSHILLACTHYPAIEPVLRTLVSAGTRFIDPASELVKIVSRWKIAPADGDQFLTTGDPNAMKAAAKNAFGISLKAVKRVVIA